MTIPGKFLSICFCTLAASAGAQDITTWQVDKQHTGANLSETILTPALVGSPGNFGLLFSQPLDGQSYSQPLYVSGLEIGGATHNVVYVTTQHDSVYAFDADSDVGPNATPLWHQSLLPAGTTPVPQSEVGSGDIGVELGITATPVIDLASQTLYTVSKVKITANSTYQQWLHALDLKTGEEKFGGPILVNPTFAGSGSDSVGGVMPFQSLRQHGRAALALHDGIVYVAYASHGDTQPYHGLVIGFDAATLQVVKTFSTSPNSNGTGIWQGGASPAIDGAGNLYVATGNGSFDQNPSPHTTATDWGEAFLKLPTTGAFTVDYANPLNWFVPSNYDNLNFGDLDLGSSGVLLLPDQEGPHPHLLVGGGKGGTLYVIDRDTMGGLHTPNNSVQEITETNSLFVTPAYFNGSIYYAPIGGKLTQRAVGYNSVNGHYLSDTAVTSNFTYSSGMGAGAFISANGNADGIVWVLDRGTPARLHAYNATSVAGDPIYTGSATLPGGIDCSGIKFTLPTVANGKVYFTTRDASNVGHLMVFGQPAPAVGTPATPANVVATPNASGKITVSWTDASDNETGFTIKRSTAQNGTYVALSPNANANETSFADATADPATKYYYQVVAFNGNGNSAPSAVASATTFPLFTQPGLVAYWNFDEGTGGTAKDATGQGVNGALGGEVTWSTGFSNTALNFHGTGAAVSRVTVPDSAALRFGIAESFTLSAWVRPEALRSADEAVIAKSRDTGNYYGIWINASNQWAFRGPGGEIAGPAVVQGSWAHVTAVQNGSAGTRSLYVNGTLVATGPAQAANGSGDLWIGQANSGGGTVIHSFPGDIDEVRLYDRALPAGEVATLLGPPLLQAASSQVHGVAGPYGRVLAPSNGKIIESLSGTAAGEYKIVLDFASPVSGISASLGLQNGGSAVGSVGTVSYDATGKIVIVLLHGVGNMQALNLHLSGIQPGGGGTADVPFNVLWGDVDGDNVVTAVDQALVTRHHEPWVDPTNAFYDINSDGFVDAADDTILSTWLGSSLGPQADTNLSPIGTATASSVEQPGVTTPSAAIDGLFNTRWSSEFSDPQWIVIDLGRPVTIHSVVLDWEDAAGKTYLIQTSDDNSSWSTVWNETNNATPGFRTYSGANATGRYLRIYGTTRISPWGYSLWEVQIMGVFPAGADDVAQGRPATASSSQPGNPAAAGNDGSGATRWAAASATWPQSWTVDLGGFRTISKMDITWYSGATRAYKYRIEVSPDNTTFTTVVDKTGNRLFGNTSDVFFASARYVRVTATGCSAGGAIASATEFRIFGH